MELIETGIPGVVIVQPCIFGDERGYFFSRFHNGILNGRYVKLFLFRIKKLTGYLIIKIIFMNKIG